MRKALSLPQLPDSELALQARRGNREAFGELVRRYQTAVFSVCYRVLGEQRDAEDLAQETFIRAFLHMDSFQPERPFGPWIRRIAANQSINFLKTHQMIALSLEEKDDSRFPGNEIDPEDAMEQLETGRTLAAAIRSLRPLQRAVIELSHFQGLSYAEIALELEISLSDVKSHLFRARKHLAEMLNHV